MAEKNKTNNSLLDLAVFMGKNYKTHLVVEKYPPPTLLHPLTMF